MLFVRIGTDSSVLLPAWAGLLVFRACGLVDVNPRKAQTPVTQKMAVGHPLVDIVLLLAR